MELSEAISILRAMSQVLAAPAKDEPTAEAVKAAMDEAHYALVRGARADNPLGGAHSALVVLADHVDALTTRLEAPLKEGVEALRTVLAALEWRPIAEAEALDAWLSGLCFTRNMPDERRRTEDGRFLPRRDAAAKSG